MSSHEIEDIVEVSIQILDELQESHGLDLRSAFHVLHRFEDSFDTGFTNFRVMDILQKHSYTYTLPPRQHPDYKQYQDYFDRLQGFEHICIKPDEVWDRESNPVAGYFQDGVLYCDVGSPLWQRLVKDEILTGEDARPLEQLKLSQVVAVVAALAEEQGSIELIRMWYAVFPIGAWFLEGTEDPDLLRRDPAVGEIREIIERTGAVAIKMSHGMLAIPSKRDIAGMPLMEWWYTLNDDQ